MGVGWRLVQFASRVCKMYDRACHMLCLLRFRVPLNADFRGRKFVNPRTDVSGTCSDECELNGQVPQPWDGHWVLVENRLAQHWVVTSPVEPDKDAVGPD